MSCNQCNQLANWRCCSSALLCTYHFGKHFTSEAIHTPEKLRLPDSALKSELSQRILKLKDLKSRIITSTNSLIKQLIDLQNSTLKDLYETIQIYQNKLNSQELLDSTTSNSILKTKMIVKDFNLEDLSQRIKEFYPNKIIEFTINTEKEMKLIRKQFLQSHNGGFRCLAVSNDGKFIVTGSDDATVRLWNFFEGKQIFCFIHHKADVNCVAISMDSSFAVSGSEDRTLVLWDLENGFVKKVLRGHSGSVESVALCMDDGVMISGCYNYELMMWNLRSFECIFYVKTKWAVYSLLVFSNEEFFSGTKNLLQKWDIKSCQVSKTILAHDFEINSIIKTSANTLIITCSSDKTIKLWIPSSLQLHTTLSGHSASVNSVCISPDDHYLISSSSDNSIIIWSLNSFSKAYQFSNHVDFIFSVKFIQNLIISVSRDGRIGITSLSSQLYSSYLSLTPFTATATTQKSQILAYGSLKTVKIWGLDEKEIILEGHNDLVQAVCFSPNMKTLISASMGVSNNLIIWDLQRRSMLKSLTGHEDFVFCVDITDDSLYAASGDRAGKVLIWNLELGDALSQLIGHKDHVYSVKWPKNKSFVVSGGKDQNVIVWNVWRKEIAWVLTGHKDFVWKVLVSEDEKMVVSASLSEGVKGWSVGVLRKGLRLLSLNACRKLGCGFWIIGA